MLEFILEETNNIMPYINSPNILFIHIPKCAGTSIEIFFNMQREACLYMAKSTIQRKIRNKNVWFSPQHYTIEMVEKYFDERKKSHNDYFKFTFVRNPYDRIISEFIWLIEHHKLQAEISKVSFERWFKDQLNSIEISDHLLLQTDFITLNPFERFDFIGKVESLEKDFEDLLVMIGWEASQSKLGNQNKRKIDLKSDFLTASVKEEIYKAYRDDFIVLGYEK